MAERPRFRSLGSILGALFLLGALLWLGDEIWFATQAVSGNAIVLSHVRTRRGNGLALLQFEANQRTFESKVTTILYFYPQPGQAVPIHYLPDQPHSARIATFAQRYLMVILLGGTACLWNAGVIVSWLRRRPMRTD